MQSGTGVYYQAMPAVGPDGKNVMKLIPVKKVNGHFVHTQVPPSRNACLLAPTCPVPLPQNKIPTLQPTADGRFILKTPLEVNTVFNSVKSQHQGPNALLQSSAKRVPDVPLIAQDMTQNTFQSPVQPNNKAVVVTNSTHLPDTVKSSAYPSGHYLQIPSNATIKTLPASSLPSSIKNRICHSTTDPDPTTGLPMVLYVSPVSSLKLDQEVPCLTNSSELSQTLSRTSTTNVAKGQEESPRSSQGGAGPRKWVVEKRAGSSAPYLIPVTSPNMSSDILKAVKHMESSRVPSQGAKEPASSTGKEMLSPGNDNALVMCNGKVYFVAKKNSEVTKDMITNTQSKLHAGKSVRTPTAALGPGTSNASQKQDPGNPADNKKPNDIIDLCDDEDESSSGTSSGSIIIPSETVSEHDDDSNVIFVSYIPPKSSETEIETNKEVGEPTSLSGCVKDDTKLDTESMETGGEMSSSAELAVIECEAVRVNGAALEGSEAPLEKLDVVCGQQTDVTEKSFEETVPDKVPQPKSDPELRQTFGITADLIVSLQKIDESKEFQAQKEKRLINKRTLDGIRKMIHDSKIETKIKRLIQTQVSKPVKTGKRIRLEKSGEKKSSDTFSLIDSHSPPNGLLECDHEIESASAEGSTDRQVFGTCEGAEEECSSSSEPAQIGTAKRQGHSPVCCSGSRKTPPRSSKGCGRACTACPCGTKVGGAAGNLASKPQEKTNPNPSSGINLAKMVPSDSNGDAAKGDRLADSVSSSNGASGNPADETTHDSPSHASKDVEVTLPAATFSITEPECQPATTGPRSSGSKCTKDETCDKIKISSQLEPSSQRAPKAKTIPSSFQPLSNTSYRIPSELYSSVLLDPEEIKRQERIKRLKDLLQEKEAALEKLRKSM